MTAYDILTKPISAAMGSSYDNELAIGNDRQGARSKNLPKYSSRHNKSAKGMYFRKIASE